MHYWERRWESLPVSSLRIVFQSFPSKVVAIRGSFLLVILLLGRKD